METIAPSTLLKTESMPDLLDLVDFKWLMATEGRRVDLTRLQADLLYARICVVSALESDCDALRHCAERLYAMIRLLGSA